jgi:AbrB family looped-hinge helix DNA binding protein
LHIQRHRSGFLYFSLWKIGYSFQVANATVHMMMSVMVFPRCCKAAVLDSHPFTQRPGQMVSLANGSLNGIFDAMKTTIDHAGRLVIPKDIRRESGIKPGMPLEVRWEKGAIAITPAPLTVKLERKGRLLVAVPSKDTPRLSSDTVERTRKTLRKERSGASN